MMSPNISDNTIITVKAVHYCCIIYGISKSDAIHLIESSALNDDGFI